MTDRDAAEALRGARIFVSRASFPTPDARRVLLGRPDRPGGASTATASTLGTVAGLIETGPHCVLRVRADARRRDGRRAADPLRRRLRRRASTSPGRRIHVDWDPDY
ncbi:MAG: hypothetical protein MZW92_71180 [Comamonadaceae bacterium]|nr:hypothetical protein [Comamonadaceae bacterium]